MLASTTTAGPKRQSREYGREDGTGSGRSNPVTTPNIAAAVRLDPSTGNLAIYSALHGHRRRHRRGATGRPSAGMTEQAFSATHQRVCGK